MRTLIRFDRPIYGPQLRYVSILAILVSEQSVADPSQFLEKAYDTNPNMRYYALRSVMKGAYHRYGISIVSLIHYIALRYIKLRTSAGSNLDELARGINQNPLKRSVDVNDPSHAYTSALLQAFQDPLDLENAIHVPLLKDRMKNGWLVWTSNDERFLAPPYTGSVFQPWEDGSAEAIEILQNVCCDKAFWSSISTYFSEENNQESVTMDHISATKSICTSASSRRIYQFPEGHL